jgi:hypothetical protein
MEMVQPEGDRNVARHVEFHNLDATIAVRKFAALSSEALTWTCPARAVLRSANMSSHAIKARVESGRVIVDEKTDLPDGEVYLVPVERGDMTPDEQARLEQAIEESIADEQAGRWRTSSP